MNRIINLLFDNICYTEIMYSDILIFKLIKNRATNAKVYFMQSIFFLNKISCNTLRLTKIYATDYFHINYFSDHLLHIGNTSHTNQ